VTVAAAGGAMDDEEISAIHGLEERFSTKGIAVVETTDVKLKPTTLVKSSAEMVKAEAATTAAPTCIHG
jgi:hypothetical protein